VHWILPEAQILPDNPEDGRTMERCRTTAHIGIACEPTPGMRSGLGVSYPGRRHVGRVKQVLTDAFVGASLLDGRFLTAWLPVGQIPNEPGR
jgi:hypothetical protein